LKKPIQQPVAPATPVAQPMQTTTPVASGRKKTSRKGTGLSTTGYTIFSAENNKQVRDNCLLAREKNIFQVREENPEAPFGELSRLIGQKWKLLTAEQKKVFEEKAKIKVR